MMRMLGKAKAFPNILIFVVLMKIDNQEIHFKMILQQCLFILLFLLANISKKNTNSYRKRAILL